MITTSVNGNCFVEAHHSTSVQYFNGRKYTFSTHHDFYQYIKNGTACKVGHVFCVYFRYVTIPGKTQFDMPRKVGHVYKVTSGIQPTNLMRGMADMVPDDMQAVSF